MICDICRREFPGLSYALSNEAWEAISLTGDLRGQLCLWCASDRLVAKGLEVRAEVSVALPGFNGVNQLAIERFEAIDYEMHKRGMHESG